MFPAINNNTFWHNPPAPPPSSPHPEPPLLPYIYCNKYSMGISINNPELPYFLPFLLHLTMEAYLILIMRYTRLRRVCVNAILVL